MTEGKQISIDVIKNKWFGVSTERPRMLMEIFEHHNNQMKDLVGKEFSPLTYERYLTSKRHTTEFLKMRAMKSDHRLVSVIFLGGCFWPQFVQYCVFTSWPQLMQSIDYALAKAK